MSENHVWTDAARNQLRETLRECVLGEVRLNNLSDEDILQTCREVYIEDDCPEDEWDDFVQFASDELSEAATRHAAERANWPPETDCDRFDRAEATLRESGILLWQVSPCCDTCTGAELPNRIDAVDEKHPGFRERVRGYAFYIDQSMAEMLAEDTHISVYLAYGWFPPDETEVDDETYADNALSIAREVCDCVAAEGLTVDWDGDFSRKIGVTLNWQRRTPLS